MQATTIFLLASVTYGTAMPQFGGFLGNIFGGFLGNRGNRGPTGQAAPAFGASQSGGGSRCGGGNSPNHQFGGQNFLLSWRIGKKEVPKRIPLFVNPFLILELENNLLL